MTIEETLLNGVLLLHPTVYGDDRGFFMEIWNEEKMAAQGLNMHFVQDNHSGSERGVLRGIHYQIQHPQGKLVRVVRGEIFDVAVDLRRHSPRFGQWFGQRLSAENRIQMWVPEGFGHGFLTLSDRTEVLYKATDRYAPEFERTIVWNDPALGIDWPLDGGLVPILSPKDERGSTLEFADVFD